MKQKQETLLAWHFTGDTLRDGSAIPRRGRWVRLPINQPAVPCRSGYHASVHVFDALQYAPGARLHRVELRGGITPHGDPIDKYAARERRILASLDAGPLLRDFARWNARRVLDTWDAPDVVREWLTTGDESLMPAAWSAAWSAAWPTAVSAAESAAESAARSAAESAAWSAAESAARSAAESAAESAAWSAAWSAAESAARSAARRELARRVTIAFKGLLS